MSEAIATLHQDLQSLVGTTIADRYRIDSLLGIGGMAAVFRAHHLGLKRDVAVKILHPELTRHPDISARFDREAHSASRLDHPNVVQVTDYGSTEAGGTLMKFMVMQLLEGGELTQLLDRPLPPRRAVGLILQILRGLEHAHRQGVVHRDIKPENIFIVRDHDDRELLKLVDFGISKIVGGGEVDGHKTKVGLIFGTPAYMSPEQAAGLDVDERADLYSVGIILYRMLSGRLPIDHTDAASLVRMQVSMDPEPLPSSVPPVLAAVVERLLAKAREARFQAASEAIATLEAMVPMLDTGMTATDYGVPNAMVGGGSNSASDITAPVVSGTDQLRTAGAVSHSIALESSPLGSGAIVVGSDSRRGIDWRLGVTFAALTAVVVGFLAWPHSPAHKPGDASAVAESQSTDPNEDQPRIGPAHAALAEIDRLLLAGKLEDADKLIAPMLDEYPRDPELLWRRGRLFGKSRRKEAQALAAYGDAIDGDPALLDDRDFYAELYELLRSPRVRDEALDLALHQLGPHGNTFLLEIVNSERKPLAYHDRQRALEAVDVDPANRPLVNRKLNMALDLLQASQSLTPCTAYRGALEAIAAAPDHYFAARVEHAPLPEVQAAPSGARNEADAVACDGLEARRTEILAMLAWLAPSADGGTSRGADLVIVGEGEAEVDSVARPNGQRGRAGANAEGDCDHLGAVFLKKCRK